MYLLYEIPFDWFFQCVVLGGTRIQAGARGAQNCRAYDKRAAHTADSYQTLSTAGDSYQTYLQYVQAGYTRANVEDYIEAHDAVNLASSTRCRPRSSWRCLGALLTPATPAARETSCERSVGTGTPTAPPSLT
jgi:hypothetical protein